MCVFSTALYYTQIAPDPKDLFHANSLLRCKISILTFTVTSERRRSMMHLV